MIDLVLKLNFMNPSFKQGYHASVFNGTYVVSEDVAVVITAMTDSERPFIKECVKSVFDNKHIAEVIVCVGKDNEWVESELDDFTDNPKLHICKITNCNAATARNHGVNISKSKWIAFCDGDDFWSPLKISKQRNFALSYDMDIVGGDHLLTDVSGSVKAYALCRTMPMTSSWFVKKEVMVKHPFNEKFKNFVDLNCSEDSEWWVRISDKIKKGRCPDPLLYYRVRGNSVSSGSRSKNRKTFLVRLGRVPLLNKLVLIGTLLLWKTMKRKKYSK